MMKNYHARGIVLSTLRYGEGAMVVFMLTDAVGRQNYMVQGVRSRGRGNKAAMLQPMMVLDLVGLESPRMQMHRIREMQSALPLRTIPFDARKSAIALFMAEVLYRLVREVEPRSPLFDFVLDSVTCLDSLDEGVANFHLWFLVRLSAYLGFYPGNDPAAGAWFDIREGLFTPILPDHRLAMERADSELLGLFMGAAADELGGIKLNRQQRSAFMTAMTGYFAYHLDAIGQVRSVQILHEVF